MEYQKIIILLDNTSNRHLNVEQNVRVEMNIDRNGVYDKKILSLKLQC